MATIAGGLGVKFEKIGYYSLGDGQLSNDPETIRDTINVMKLTAILFFLIVMLPLFMFIGIVLQTALENALIALL